MIKTEKLCNLADIDISNVDKKSKDGEFPVKLCNFVDVYYNWAITKNRSANFMAATANSNQIKRFSLKKGCVAITKDSETRNDMGIPAYIADDIENLVLGYHCAVIKPKSDVLNGKFLAAVLNSAYARKYFDANASGSGQRYTLTNEIIENFPVPVLSIEQQTAIGELFSNMDRKIELNQIVCQNLEGIAKLLYDYWFVQFDFPDENGKPYKSSGGKMVWSEELKREIPEGWSSTTLEHTLKIFNGRDHKELEDGNIPVYGSGGFMKKVDKALYTGESILIPRKGTLNNIMYVNEAFWTVDTMFYSVSTIENSGLYQYYALKQFDFEKLNVGSAVPSMTMAIIYGLKILLPKEKELRLFNEKATTWYQTIFALQTENETLISLRDFLLPMLMNGQVKIKDHPAKE